MNTECLDPDRISTLPQNISEKILTLMPIRDALRTSILSKKWRYSWRSMPKLEFKDDMVKVDSKRACDSCEEVVDELKKYKLVGAIFHVLLLHDGPAVLEFHFWYDYPGKMDSEFDQIISHLAISRAEKVKELLLQFFRHTPYKLPVSFFSLQGLEVIDLHSCTFEPPSTFSGFSRLKSMKLLSVEVSAHVLHRFLSVCPLLEEICLGGCQVYTHFVVEGNKFTFVDLFQCVPLIRSLEISGNYMEYLCAGGMPDKLPTSPVNLKHLFLVVSVGRQHDMSSALCIIRSSPLLVNIEFVMCGTGWEKLSIQQTPMINFLDPKYSDLKLDHLETFKLDIYNFENLPLGPFAMDFMKLIMAKSRVLKKVVITLCYPISVDEELEMLRDLLVLPFTRASPSAKLIIKR